jgi:hypothetical protein
MKPIERFIIGKKKMMMTEKNTYCWLFSCLVVGGLLLLSGCSGGSSGDDVPPSEQAYLQLGAVTRTAGAFEINDPATNIQLFLATQAPTNEDPNHYTLVEKMYSYSTDHWSSLTPFLVKENTQYYLYGYMPSSISAIQSAPDGDYSKGIDLAFTGLPAITTDDICVLVGVQRVGANSTSSQSVTEGQYGFITGIKGQNYLNLLMAHLYAKMKVSFMIDPAYAELRSIRLKTITLSSKYADGASEVSLRSGQGIGSPTFQSGSGEQVHSVILLDTEKILNKSFVSTPLTLDIPAYCRPMGLEGTYHLTLTTTYDVYDTKNQNLGERTSENKIDFNMAEIRPGQEKDIVLTVKPTYLYILSEYDADNPTITLGE